MNIRFSGPPDLIDRIAEIVRVKIGISPKIYPNRNSQDVRLYVTLDDREAEKILNRLDQPAKTPCRRV